MENKDKLPYMASNPCSMIGDTYVALELALKFAIFGDKASFYGIDTNHGKELVLCDHYGGGIGEKDGQFTLSWTKYNNKWVPKDKDPNCKEPYSYDYSIPLIPLPFTLDFNNITDFVSQWLKNNPPSNESYPDTDGSARKGWHVFREREYSGEILRVKSCWIEYGK